MLPPVLMLPPDQLHLWAVRTELCQDPFLLAQYQRLMDETEWADWLRYRVEKKRHEYLLARALLRGVLSHYAPIRPEQWRFSRSATGKPAIDWPQTLASLSNSPDLVPALEFNLSHTEGMIICALSLEASLGIDVEDTTRPVEFLPLARRFFHPTETALLESLPPEQLPLAFYRLWTLKEAYLKAVGAGLTASLDSFSFRWPKTQLLPPIPLAMPSGWEPVVLNLPEQNAPQLVLFCQTSGSNPNHWQFREFLLGGRFQVALAVARPSQNPLQLILRQTIPLQTPP
ncbi:MAG: 4'-phosphopantetheinyl transferase superfamily protein [Thermoguttaceae bacterium]|nr:4'-phosphopantetheinyl transferase superfamily protein [Thermoguttaceae bacterium]